MKVSPITRNYYANSSPMFGSTTRVVHKSGFKMYANFTEFLRPDFPWKPFIDLVEQKYRNVPKINILNFACSDGSEPYTLAMLLKDRFGNNANRFFPIKAYDFDEDIIDLAKEKTINFGPDDLYRLSQEVPNWEKDYFKIIRTSLFGPDRKITPRNSIKNAVEFEQKELPKDFPKEKLTNTIVFARNFWPYMERMNYKVLAIMMAEILDDTCLVALGALEKTFQIGKLLEKEGFIKTNVDSVYTLPKKS